MKKNPTLYIIIIAVWTCCLALLITSFAFLAASLQSFSAVKRTVITVLLAVNTATLAVLWLGSVKDFVFSVAYTVSRKRLAKIYDSVAPYDIPENNAPEFLLLYCTCNDFNEKALSACRKQNYPNFKTVILDDSSDPEYIRRINKYRATHGNVFVHRRKDKTGYKAGNLNSYLSAATDYDYFVVLDSDEIIPPDYITGVMKYFNSFPDCGAVQARHKATKGENFFQRLMGLCVGSNGSTVQIIKNFYGANALIGHGMTISRECYEKTGGFPLVVAEDISFAVDIKNAGFEIIYAPDIECCEEFPVNYVSLKKRQCKWTQGNLEYMRKYNADINNSEMSWYEKLDVKLSHYSLPIVPVLSFLLTICTIALGFFGYPVIRYSLIVYSIMIIFLCSPLIPDIIVYHNKSEVFLLIPYFVVNIATYASLAPMMLRTIFLGLCGKKAAFLVTPKQTRKFSVKEALLYSWDSVLFAVVIGILSCLSCRSILPVIFITVGCLSAPLIILLSNITVKQQKQSVTVVKSEHKSAAALPAPLADIAHTNRKNANLPALDADVAQ